MKRAVTNGALTEEEIIRKHDPQVRGRAYIELQIVNALITAAAEADYTLRIDELDEDDMQSYYGGDFRTALFDLDDAHVSVLAGTRRIGWVYFVFGNDGYDCVSDYSVRLGEFLKPVDAVADKWGGA
jgi:hypothetical protein